MHYTVCDALETKGLAWHAQIWMGINLSVEQRVAAVDGLEIARDGQWPINLETSNITYSE